MLTNIDSLNLETIGSPSSSGLLELSALALDVGLDSVVRVQVVHGGTVAEVCDGLAGVLGATEEHGVRSLGGEEGELVQGHARAAGGSDGLAGLLGKAEGGDLEGRELKGTLVASDGTDNDGGLADLVVTLHISSKSGNGDRSLVKLGHPQALADGLGELGVTATGDEREELLEKLDIHVLRHGGLSRVVADSATSSLQINSHLEEAKGMGWWVERR